MTTEKRKPILKINYLMNFGSWLLIFALLSNCLYIPCYQYMLKIHRANVINSYQNALDSDIAIIDSSFDSFNALQNLILSDSSYNELHYSYDGIEDQTLNKLRRIIKTHTIFPYNFIVNFGLVRESELLLTREHIFFDREYLSSEYYFKCDENYFGEFDKMLFFLPSKHFASSSFEEYDAITLGACLSRQHNLYLFIHYSFPEMINNFVDKQILDSSCISFYYDDMLLNSQGNLSIEDPFTMLTCSSNTNRNFRIELRLANSYIEKDLVNFKQLANIFIIVILFAACFWSILFAIKISAPFRFLSNTLSEAGISTAKNHQSAALSSLLTGIKQMGTQLSDLKYQIEEQNKQNKIHILEKALYRGLFSENDYRYFAKVFDDFPTKWRLVFINYFAPDDIMALESAQSILANFIMNNLSQDIVFTYTQDTLLLFSSEYQHDILEEKLKNLQENLEEKYQISISYTITRTYTHVSQLSTALQELEYETMLRPTQSENNSVFPIHQIECIYHALQNGNKEVAISILQSANIFDSPHSSINLFEAKRIYQMIAYVLIQIKIENNLLDIPIPNFKQTTVQSLFETELPHCFAQIAEHLNQKDVDQKTILLFQIQDFINTNIYNQQLCISMITDYFHISAPTLQKHILSCYGTTFSAYVEKKRMEKAQQLLQDPAFTIQEITEMIGYTNTNSFYKAFKRNFGHSPRSSR